MTVQSKLLDARSSDEDFARAELELSTAMILGLDCETQDEARHAGLNAYNNKKRHVFDHRRTTMTGFSFYADGSDTAWYVNLAHADKIRRVLVFACIYEGASAFEQAEGVVTLTPASGAPIEVLLDEAAGSSRMCAVALLENNGGELTVRREVQYIKGAQDVLDKTYNWGMDWTPGRK